MIRPFDYFANKKGGEPKKLAPSINQQIIRPSRFRTAPMYLCALLLQRTRSRRE